MSRLIRKLVILSALIMLLTGCQSLFRTSAEEQATTPTPIPTPIVPDKPTYVVQQGDITKQVEFTGRISPVEEKSLYFKAGGYVKQVLVERNDQVHEGDLLAELEIDDLLKQMAQAEVSLNSAQLRLNEAEKSLERQTSQAEMGLTIAEARLNEAKTANSDAITQAETSLTIAQEQLTRLQARKADYDLQVLTARIGLAQAAESLADAQAEYQKALDRPWEPDEVRTAYARALRNAERSHEIAWARYAQALAAQEVYQHDLSIQELAIDQVEAQLAQLKRGVAPLLTIDVQIAQEELEWLKAGVDPVLVNDVNQAQLNLERLEAQVLDAQIVAPMDGEVLSLSAFPGRPAEAFKPVIVIADSSAIEVSADLTSSSLQDLVEEQEAVISLSSIPGRTWQGSIRRLPFPYGTGGGTGRLEDVDESVRISVEGDLSELELGDLARVIIVLEEKQDVLWLPPAAIRTFQGRKFVIVQETDRQRRVDVQVGIDSQDRVEILEGLEKDQIIIGQ